MFVGACAVLRTALPPFPQQSQGKRDSDALWQKNAPTFFTPHIKDRRRCLPRVRDSRVPLAVRAGSVRFVKNSNIFCDGTGFLPCLLWHRIWEVGEKNAAKEHTNSLPLSPSQPDNTRQIDDEWQRLRKKTLGKGLGGKVQIRKRKKCFLAVRKWTVSLLLLLLLLARHFKTGSAIQVMMHVWKLLTLKPFSDSKAETAKVRIRRYGAVFETYRWLKTGKPFVVVCLCIVDRSWKIPSWFPRLPTCLLCWFENF